MSDDDLPIRWSYLGRNYRMLFVSDDEPGAAAALATPRQLKQAGFVRADPPLSTPVQAALVEAPAIEGLARALRVLPKEPVQVDAPSELWGVWGERHNCSGFWIQAKAGSSEPLQTSRADAERRAANLNREQETRTDSVGWRYEARPHIRPAELSNHDWQITSQEYDDTFFKCVKCGAETNARRGYPDPQQRGPCANKVEPDQGAKPVSLGDVIRAARESRDAGRYAAAFGYTFEAIEMLAPHRVDRDT